ncbi:lysine--tRNA ligase [Candidatus Dependentiae bacterium]|nr:MAG: lysine--tRNA ligase [Candidatus Dependentiae bacterium]
MKKDNDTPTQSPEELASEEHQVRVGKVHAMRKAGIEPWPEAKPVDATALEVLSTFKEDDEAQPFSLAGRVVSLRKHGKTAFAHLQDRSGKIQIYVRKDGIGETAFDHFESFVDVGDILWVQGNAFRTKMGEITVKVKEFELLSKSLHPLPEKFHGLTDIEIKYRRRYLDLISNEESRKRFYDRSKIIKTLRQFLDEHDFMEVETPILHPIPGGATARPFVTHHNALGTDFYLRIAPELYLKRLVVGGLERVYEIGRVFRNEGISTKHNPEFTMLELYVAHHNYEWMMDFTEQMIQAVVRVVRDDSKVSFGEHSIDFGKPFERISMRDAVIKYGNVSEQELEEKSIDATLKKYGIELDKKGVSWGEKLCALFDELVESKLINPTFITHYPIEISPLAKRDPKNPDVVLRFELFVAGMELCNAFNELNDPFDQAERFKQQAGQKEAGDAEAHHYDADYVTALEHALPPTVGFGIGIDRLTMLLTNTTSIKDVILFPTLRQ